ncbi:uncharacterized protein VTP21DRAFT_8178, partial [Calcarisporiella thermophila]|uniref:uncharacterized protein n=1 Tax=Calcarisporiella thermophila TaxID=911321 RepID=UPI0037434CE2
MVQGAPFMGNKIDNLSATSGPPVDPSKQSDLSAEIQIGSQQQNEMSNIPEAHNEDVNRSPIMYGNDDSLTFTKSTITATSSWVSSSSTSIPPVDTIAEDPYTLSVPISSSITTISSSSTSTQLDTQNTIVKPSSTKTTECTTSDNPVDPIKTVYTTKHKSKRPSSTDCTTSTKTKRPKTKERIKTTKYTTIYQSEAPKTSLETKPDTTNWPKTTERITHETALQKTTEKSMPFSSKGPESTELISSFISMSPGTTELTTNYMPSVMTWPTSPYGSVTTDRETPSTSNYTETTINSTPYNSQDTFTMPYNSGPPTTTERETTYKPIPSETASRVISIPTDFPDPDLSTMISYSPHTSFKPVGTGIITSVKPDTTTSLVTSYPSSVNAVQVPIVPPLSTNYCSATTITVTETITKTTTATVINRYTQQTTLTLSCVASQESHNVFISSPASSTTSSPYPLIPITSGNAYPPVLTSVLKDTESIATPGQPTHAIPVPPLLTPEPGTTGNIETSVQPTLAIPEPSAFTPGPEESPVQPTPAIPEPLVFTPVPDESPIQPTHAIPEPPVFTPVPDESP